jgi:hypothetical protein
LNKVFNILCREFYYCNGGRIVLPPFPYTNFSFTLAAKVRNKGNTVQGGEGVVKIKK